VRFNNDVPGPAGITVVDDENFVKGGIEAIVPPPLPPPLQDTYVAGREDGQLTSSVPVAVGSLDTIDALDGGDDPSLANRDIEMLRKFGSVEYWQYEYDLWLLKTGDNGGSIDDPYDALEFNRPWYIKPRRVLASEVTPDDLREAFLQRMTDEAMFFGSMAVGNSTVVLESRSMTVPGARCLPSLAPGTGPNPCHA
jgi:hypothetical protein